MPPPVFTQTQWSLDYGAPVVQLVNSNHTQKFVVVSVDPNRKEKIPIEPLPEIASQIDTKFRQRSSSNTVSFSNVDLLAKTSASKNAEDKGGKGFIQTCGTLSCICDAKRSLARNMGIYQLIDVSDPELTKMINSKKNIRKTCDFYARTMMWVEKSHFEKMWDVLKKRIYKLSGRSLDDEFETFQIDKGSSDEDIAEDIEANKEQEDHEAEKGGQEEIQ
ncbi:hypothetical protein BJ742DRAFT_734675 [Cladochytrium replicatum]|nr:hypothetical protein BJ742DRAFT_734675 [Cladochytrium replicatum]